MKNPTTIYTMNLLDSIKKFLRFFKPGSILLIPVFLGCDAASDLGTQFDLDTNIDVNLMELNFPSTNVYLDSLRTDGEDRLVAGTFNDPLTGRITTETYFQFGFLSGSVLPADTLEFDSAQITLSTVGVLPLTDPFTYDIDIYELEDTLINSVVYLSTKRERVSRRVGNLTTTASSEDEVITFKLEDSYGREIFNILNNKPDSIGTASLFFKGLALASGTTNQGLVSFDARADTSKLRLYMSGNATEIAEFSIRTSLHTYVERDRSASPYNGIIEKENFDIPGDGRTALDPLAGITTAFNIEGLKSFFEDNPNILINTTILDLVAEDIAAKDTLQGFHLFFRKPDGGIFGPGLVFNPFSNVVMTDQGYLNGANTPAPIAFNPDTDQYIVTPTIFFQALYNNYQNWKDENDGVPPDELFYTDPILSDTIQISDMVLINPQQMTLEQAVFQNSGIKLRIFYTDAN